jgi:hypothetical protein
MVVILMVLITAAILIGIFIEGANLTEQGTPAKDCDILEMLEKCEAEYGLEKKWNDKFKLNASYRSNAPSIHQTQFSIIFPYYISNVGVVPIWYKSASKIKKMFEEKISASKYNVTKRDKLGLNK